MNGWSVLPQEQLTRRRRKCRHLPQLVRGPGPVKLPLHVVICVSVSSVYPVGGSRSLLHQSFFMSAYKFRCDASLIPGFSVLEVLVANTLLDPPALSTPFHTLIFPARYSVPSHSASSLTICLPLLTDSDSLYPSVISHSKTQNKFDPYDSRRRPLLFIIDTDCVHFPAMHLCDRTQRRKVLGTNS